MNPKKTQATFMNIGASSLLVIFLVLCIAVFATLSLSSAQSDYSFSQQMAQHKTAYYTTLNQAEQILDQVDAVLAKTATQSTDSQDFYNKSIAALEDELLNIPILKKANTGIPTLQWQIPIDDTQALLVQLALRWPYDNPGDDNGFYHITKWQTITINE